MHERSKAQDPSGFWVAEDGDTILGLEVRFAMDSPLEREGFDLSFCVFFRTIQQSRGSFLIPR
jgi:hypothetical protein